MNLKILTNRWIIGILFKFQILLILRNSSQFLVEPHDSLQLFWNTVLGDLDNFAYIFK